MMMIWPLLRRLWWLVPVLGIAGYLWWQHAEIGRLRADLATARTTVVQQRDAVAQLRAGVDAQNAGVERILEQGVANEQAARQGATARAANVAKVQVIYRTRIEQIESAQVPTQCASAAAWAARQAQGLADRWSK